MDRKRVLIADDDPHLVKVLGERCRQLGLDVDSVGNGLEAITGIARNSPDLVILDVMMPHGDGASVFETMSANPKLATIPVVFLSGASNEDAIHRCEAMGAHYVLKGFDAWETLEPILRDILHPHKESALGRGERQAERGRALVVEDDAEMLAILEVRLAQRGVDVRGAASGLRGFWAALRSKPDVIITDYCMPEGRADFLIRRLKDHPVTCNIPVIVITGRGGKMCDYGLEREMRNLGAVAYLRKPLDFDALWLLLDRFLPVREPHRLGAANAFT